MIQWLAPAALAGLALVSLPILVHFLRAHRARRVAFPTLRFLLAAKSSAVRPRRPSDLPLLLVRMGVVAAAALAAAQPLWLGVGRAAGWDRRVARAVVVEPGAEAEADAIARTELESAYLSRRFDDTSVRDGLVRAAAWLDAAPPARREIVVVGRLPVGTLDAPAVAAVPDGVGVRFARVGDDPGERGVDGPPLFGAPGIPSRSQRWTLSAAGTSAQIETATGSEPQAGLRTVTAAADEHTVAALLRAVARAGAPAPDPDRPIVLAFPGANVPGANVDAVREPWMLDALVALNGRLAASLMDGEPAGEAPTLPSGWMVAARTPSGSPLASAAAVGNELWIATATKPDTLTAAAVVRASLEAVRGSGAWPGLEPVLISDAQLQTWTRAAGAPDASAWRRVGSSDARWLWGAVLLLLGVEQWMRRARASVTEDVRAAA